MCKSYTQINTCTQRIHILHVCTRVVGKVRGQSDLRQNYCVLCRMTYVLSNDYQLKISMQKNHMILKLFSKDTEIFILHELDLRSTILYFHDVRWRQTTERHFIVVTLFAKWTPFSSHTFPAISPFIKRMFTPLFVKFLYNVFVSYRRSMVFCFSFKIFLIGRQQHDPCV